MDVSIIYVNYKTNEILENSIKSVIKKTQGCTYEIIVVDNSNEEEILKNLKESLHRIDSNIKVIDAKSNLGFGRANNLGVKYAVGKYILFLNNDTLLINDAISILKKYLDTHLDVGIVGPNIYDVNLKPAHSFYRYEKNIENYQRNNGFCKSLYSKFLNKRSDHNYKKEPTEIFGYICGACMMIKKELFEKVNGFDSDIFMYAEETLLNYRVIHETNKRIFNVPKAKIIHLEGSSFNSSSTNRIKMMVDGNWIYLKKAFGTDYAIEFAKKEICYDQFKGLIRYIVAKEKDNYFNMMAKAWKNKLKEITR